MRLITLSIFPCVYRLSLYVLLLSICWNIFLIFYWVNLLISSCRISLYYLRASPLSDMSNVFPPKTWLVCFLNGIISWAEYWWRLTGLPCGLAGKESACNAGYLGSIPGLGRSPEKGKGYPLKYSGLENSMDYIVHGVI